MTAPTPSNPSRRQFFIAGGATAVAAAALAACSGSSVVDTSGTAPTTLVAATAPPTTANEATLDVGRSVLRTATSIEHSLAAFYEKFDAAAFLADDARTWGRLFADHHTANAKSLELLTTKAGGKAYTGTNSYVDEQLVTPDLKLAQSQKSSDGLITLAAQLEDTAASTGTLGIATVVEPELRQGLMAVAATNARQAYLWRLLLKPGDLADALPDAQYSLRNAVPGSASVDPPPSK